MRGTDELPDGRLDRSCRQARALPDPRAFLVAQPLHALDCTSSSCRWPLFQVLSRKQYRLVGIVRNQPNAGRPGRPAVRSSPHWKPAGSCGGSDSGPWFRRLLTAFDPGCACWPIRRGRPEQRSRRLSVATSWARHRPKSSGVRVAPTRPCIGVIGSFASVTMTAQALTTLPGPRSFRRSQGPAKPKGGCPTGGRSQAAFLRRTARRRPGSPAGRAGSLRTAGVC
jgi:hypothetical protein